MISANRPVRTRTPGCGVVAGEENTPVTTPQPGVRVRTGRFAEIIGL